MKNPSKNWALRSENTSVAAYRAHRQLAVISRLRVLYGSVCDLIKGTANLSTSSFDEPDELFL